MPFSQHSHSGQFCPGHADNTLSECIEAAISARLLVFGLTEHMPRHSIDFYPEERAANPPATLEGHFENEERYVAEALRLREEFKGRIELPLGFECEWIRGESRELIERSIERYYGKWDYVVGSVHHVHAVPVDYDQVMYDEVREKAGGSDERLFEDYFDGQLDMLKAVRPIVVGHFDLVRLKSQDPDVYGGWQSMRGVWERMLRNLDVVAEYGGIMEVNTAALRKGMKEPYPKEEVIKAALDRNIRFCLSDDSHGVLQVAYGYQQALDFLKECGVKQLHYLRHRDSVESVVDDRFPCLEICQTDLEEVRARFMLEAS